MKRIKLFTYIHLVALLLVGISSFAKPVHTPLSPLFPPIDNNSKLTALKNAAPRINTNVLNLALTAYNKARQKGLDKKQILTVIDYSLADTEKRMWVFDVKNNTVLFNTLVAHGQGSGDVYPTKFSNESNSKASSLGLYLTENTYFGGEGYSLRLMGLSAGFNDNAQKRNVVVHGAWYVSEDFVKKYHRLGRSWGCQAISKELAKPVINTIKEGTLLFAYANDKNWLKRGTNIFV